MVIILKTFWHFDANSLTTSKAIAEFLFKIQIIFKLPRSLSKELCQEIPAKSQNNKEWWYQPHPANKFRSTRYWTANKIQCRPLRQTISSCPNQYPPLYVMKTMKSQKGMYLLAFRGVHIDFRAQIKGKSAGMFSKFSKILRFLPYFNFFRSCAEQLLMMINVVYNQVVASNGCCTHPFF